MLRAFSSSRGGSQAHPTTDRFKFPDDRCRARQPLGINGVLPPRRIEWFLWVDMTVWKSNDESPRHRSQMRPNDAGQHVKG